MTTPTVTPQTDWFSANAPSVQPDWFSANAPPPAIQKPAIQMEEDSLGKAYAAKEEVGKAVAKGTTDLANDVYDVSTPGIAEQIYRHMKGMPNKLDQIPGKMVLAFLAAGGLGPEIEAASAKVHAEETIKPEAAGQESAEDFVNRQTAGRATVKPDAEGNAVDAQTGEAVKPPDKGTYRVYDQGTVTENPKQTQFFATGPEGESIDLRTDAQKQASVKDMPRDQPDTWKRGPKKGQAKTYRVFDQGKWIEVPKYKAAK